MILKNDSKIEKHLIITCITQGSGFIISSEYITFESTKIINSMLLKDTNNKNLLATFFKQLCSYTKS